MPNIGAISSKATPCINPLVTAPNIFPITILGLDNGATKISLIKPNSLSHTKDIVASKTLTTMLKTKTPL